MFGLIIQSTSRLGRTREALNEIVRLSRWAGEGRGGGEAMSPNCRFKFQNDDFRRVDCEWARARAIDLKYSTAEITRKLS